MYTNYPQYKTNYPQYFGEDVPPVPPGPTPDPVGDYTIVKYNDMPDVHPNGYALITGYVGNKTDLTIPLIYEGVPIVGIDEYAFYQNTNIESVYIMDESEFQVIGQYAFDGCSSLESLRLPEGIYELSIHSFANTAITEIYLPSTLEVFSGAFNDETTGLNNVLTKVEFADGIDVISSYAFSGCTALTDVIIHNVASKEIKDHAFSGCTSLASIDLSNTDITIIGERTFEGCTSLETITLPSNLTTLGVCCFNNTDIEEITIPKTVTVMGNASTLLSPYISCFTTSGTGNNSNLKRITFESGITSIPPRACDQCRNLIEVNMPSTVTSIGMYAFRTNVSLTNVTLPPALTDMAYGCFAGSNISEITIPKTVTTCTGGGPFSIGAVASNTLRKVTFESGTTKIPDKILDYCNGITELNIPNTVTEIGEKALSSGGRYTSASPLWRAGYSIPEGIQKIGAYAFQGMYHDHAEFICPSTLRTLGEYAFSDMEASNYMVFTLNDDLNDVKAGNPIFNNTKVVSIVIPSGFRRVNATSSRSLFASSSYAKLTTVEFAEGFNGTYSNYNNYLFRNCTGLTTVKIPSTMTIVPNYCFQGCTAITDVYYNDTYDKAHLLAFRTGNDPLTDSSVTWHMTDYTGPYTADDVDPGEF